MRHRHHKTSVPKPTAKQQRARNLTRKARYAAKSKSNLTGREARTLVRADAARRELKYRDRLVEEEP